MTKTKRVLVGKVLKGKTREDGTTPPPYIKMSKDVKLLKDQIISVESKKVQLESLARAVANGKINADFAKQIEENINKMPDFVLFELFAKETVNS
jgi:hypothetical protein